MHLLAVHGAQSHGNRTAEQAEGGKVVGVDPAVITAGKRGLHSGI